MSPVSKILACVGKNRKAGIKKISPKNGAFKKATRRDILNKIMSAPDISAARGTFLFAEAPGHSFRPAL